MFDSVPNTPLNFAMFFKQTFYRTPLGDYFSTLPSEIWQDQEHIQNPVDHLNTSQSSLLNIYFANVYLLANNKKKRFLICYASCPKETKLLIRLSVVLKKANKRYSFSVISFAIQKLIKQVPLNSLILHVKFVKFTICQTKSMSIFKPIQIYIFKVLFLFTYFKRIPGNLP